MPPVNSWTHTSGNDQHFSEPGAQADGLTEDTVALAFERANDGKFLFNATRGQWLTWNGSIWEPDETGLVQDSIRVHCRSYGDDLQELRKTRAVEGYCRTARI